MIEAYKKYWRQYADFKGRTSRADFWWAFLANCLVGTIVSFLMFMDSEGIGFMLYGIYSLVVFIPTLSISVRRLHDIDKSGWWYLINCVPCAGYIVFLVFLCLPGTSGSNKYGPDSYVRRQQEYPPSDLSAYPPPGNSSLPYTVEDVPIHTPKVYITGLGGSMDGRNFEFGQHEILIGREASCSIRYPGDTNGISRSHCKLLWQNGTLMLMDLNSTYGTYTVSGKLTPMYPVPLRNGDVFYLAEKKNCFRVQIL